MEKTIDECFYKIQNGVNIKQGDINNGYPITRIETIANDKFNRDRMGYAGITDLSKYKSYILEDGDLLMSHINSVQYLGRTVFYEKKEDETIIHGMNLLRLKARKDIINPEYARYCFYGYLFRSQIANITKKSVNQASFSVQDLKKIKIDVPDIELQKQIVEIFNKVSKIIVKRQQELDAFEELIRARFVEMFGDIQSEEKYKNIKLKEICNTVSGGTPSTRISEYYNGEIPWITTVSLGDNYINGVGAKAYITKSAIDNSATKLIPAGNILFGTRVGVGKSSINMVDLCTNQDIVAIIDIDTNKFDRLFIKHVLDMNQPYYDSLKKGATILGITSEDLKDSIIPNVPIEVQNKFSEFVLQIDKSKVEVKKALDEAQLLFDSLMQKYFG